MKNMFFVNKYCFYAPKGKEVSEIAKYKLDNLNREVLELMPMLKNPHFFGIFITNKAFSRYSELTKEYLKLAENEQWI